MPEADDAGAGQDRGNLEAERPERGQHEHDQEQHRRGHAQQGQQGQQARALVGLVRRAGWRHTAQALIDRGAQRDPDDVRQERQGGDADQPQRDASERTFRRRERSERRLHHERADTQPDQHDEEARGREHDARHDAILILTPEEEHQLAQADLQRDHRRDDAGDGSRHRVQQPGGVGCDDEQREDERPGEARRP